MSTSLVRAIGLQWLVAASAIWGQTPATPLTFEVASVKPSGPLDPARIASGKMRIGMKIDKARVDIGSMSLSDLIRTAYRVKSYQISGPDWMNTERFDVQATLPEGASPDQVPEMLQALLADRFKMTMHRESKDHAVYALVVGKGGSKLKESVLEAEVPSAEPGRGGATIEAGENKVRITGNGDGKGVVVSGGPAGTTKMSMGPGGLMHMESSKMTLDALADMLSRFVDRPVVDMTALKGNYQVALDLSMEDLKNIARTAGITIPGPAGAGDAAKSPADAASEPSGLSIFAAVQQMGLKLEPRKAPVASIVIDHLEKMPTEN